MVDSDVDSRGLIKPPHMGLEVGSVAITVTVVTRHKQICMDHLMKKGFYQVLARTQLQQGLTQGYNTEASATLISVNRSDIIITVSYYYY